MYHCYIQFHFMGPWCRVFDVIKEMPPLEHFTHTYTQNETQGADVTVCIKEMAANLQDSFSGADVLVMNLQGVDATEVLEVLSGWGCRDARFILLGDKEQAAVLAGSLKDADDIWVFPLSEDEVRFRFLKWQKNCKQEKDFWQTNQYLETAMNSTPNLLWYKDKEGIHKKVNESFCKTVNKTRKQVEGRDHFYIWNVDRDDPENAGHDCMESELEVFRRKTTCISEETVKSGDEMKLLTTYKSPLYDLDGSVMGTVGVGIDVTQERTYEQEIVKKNNTLEAIFTTLDCGVLCHTIDGKRILNVNKAALEILGYESQEEMMAEGFDMVAPSVLDEDKLKLRACILSLKKEGDGIGIEYRVQQKDGGIRHIMGNVKLIKENGELCYQRFLLDCTAQKNEEAKKEHRQTELIKALSIDYSLACFFDMDTGIGMPLRIDESEGEFASIFNSELSFSESMERYIEDFVFEEDRERVRQAVSQERLNKELAEKSIYHVNYRCMLGGGPRYYEMKAVRTGNWDEGYGIVLGFKSVDEEIRSELEQKKLLKEALMQANQANESKSVFLANMSHEIRTPMNAICGMADLLLDEELSSVGREYATTIKSSGESLLNIINDILDFSRIESGKMPIVPVEYYFASMVHDLISMMEQRVRGKSVKLVPEIQDDIPRKLYGDVGRIRQILINIMGNATKFTHKGTITLRITWEQEEENNIRLNVSVLDTGIGIKPENLNKLFDAFEQVDMKKNLGLEGTGLGLSIAKLLVERMDGKIWVESEYGKGSNFSFTILQKVVDSAPCEYNKNHREAEVTTFEVRFEAPAAKVMVVDDNRINLKVAFGLLKKFGVVPDLIGSGQECLEKLQETEQYDLVFMDHMMPEMDGIEAAKRIREMGGRFTELPIVALSANAVKGMEQEFLAGGMDDFLAKPIELKALSAILEKWLPKEIIVQK